MAYKKVEDFLNYVEQKNPHQKEFHQAVREVAETLWPFLEKNPRYFDASILDRIVEPTACRPHSHKLRCPTYFTGPKLIGLPARRISLRGHAR